MKVKMLVTLTGTRDGVDWPARGGVVDLPADEAAQMVAAGLAESVSVKVETAAAAPVAVESATVSTKPSRRKA